MFNNEVIATGGGVFLSNKSNKYIYKLLVQSMQY